MFPAAAGPDPVAAAALGGVCVAHKNTIWDGPPAVTAYPGSFRAFQRHSTGPHRAAQQDRLLGWRPRSLSLLFCVAELIAVTERQNKYYKDSVSMLSAELTNYGKQQAASSSHEAGAANQQTASHVLTKWCGAVPAARATGGGHSR